MSAHRLQCWSSMKTIPGQRLFAGLAGRGGAVPGRGALPAQRSMAVTMIMIMQVTHHVEPSLGCCWASVKDAGTIPGRIQTGQMGGYRSTIR